MGSAGTQRECILEAGMGFKLEGIEHHRTPAKNTLELEGSPKDMNEQVGPQCIKGVCTHSAASRARGWHAATPACGRTPSGCGGAEAVRERIGTTSAGSITSVLLREAVHYLEIARVWRKDLARKYGLGTHCRQYRGNSVLNFVSQSPLAYGETI